MMDELARVLLEPFAYDYMLRAMSMCTLVGGVCAFLSAFLMLKGWSLIGDALAHAVVPGVAVAYWVGFPFAAGAFASGLLAAASMNFVQQKTALRPDVIIGMVFTGFLASGLLIISLNPTAVNVQSIILGNILGINEMDMIQIIIIAVVTLFVLLLKWRDLMHVFFDEAHANSLGMPVRGLKIMFFMLLSACTVAALQTVGACLVIAMVVTPGAAAYMLTDRFDRLIICAMLIGALTSLCGAYLSYFVSGAAGGVIVLLQTIVFFVIFLCAPKYGYFKRQKWAVAT